MKKLFSLFITSLLMLSTTVLYAQVVVQGIVVDSNNEQPLIGANVVVKGTTIGSSTGVREFLRWAARAVVGPRRRL